MGQRGRTKQPLTRASCWIDLIFSTALSSVAAMAPCIGMGSTPSTKYGVQP
jgi:hypothetical protein